jgi:hypothetical protein
MVGMAGIPIQPLVPTPNAPLRLLGPLTQPRLRDRNPLFILAKAIEPVGVRLTNVQLAHYRPGSRWVVVGPDGARLAEGHPKVNESAEVRFTPDKDGVYGVVVASGNNSYRLEMLTGQRYAYEGSEQQRFTVNGVFGRLYFFVPPGVERFNFFVKAEGQAPGRGGKLTVFGPDGKAAAHLEGGSGDSELASARDGNAGRGAGRDAGPRLVPLRRGADQQPDRLLLAEQPLPLPHSRPGEGPHVPPVVPAPWRHSLCSMWPAP